MQPALPIAPEDRIEAMDVLRGFALLGILLVNVLFFCAPAQETIMKPWRETTDPWLLGLVFWLVQGKFYCLFSFLFGAGFSVQTARLEARGARTGSIYTRRQLVLLGIGLLHGVLLWMGDILAAYALAGLLLLAFRKRQPRTLLIWAAVLLALATLVWALFWVAILVAQTVPAAAQEMHRAAEVQAAEMARRSAEALRAYAQGPYALLFQVRLKELATNYGMTLAILPQILAMFLLGAWAGRTGILGDPAGHRRLLRRVAAWGFLVALPLSAGCAWVFGKGFPGPANPGAMLAFALLTCATPGLSLAYAAGLVLLLQKAGAGAFLRRLASPGRMALSNYLGQSVVMTTLFYFYGFGLYGRVPLPAAYGLALVLFALQVLASRAWLSRFSMGPAEWLWRRLTYGHAPAFRKAVR